MTSSLESIAPQYPNSDSDVKRPNYPPSDNRFAHNPGMDKSGQKLPEVLARNVRRYMDKDSSISRQELLEAKSGLGQSTISRVLNAGGAATLDTVEALARAIGCEPWELLIDDDSVRESIVKRYLGR